MNDLLLDTHALIWALIDPPKLSEPARAQLILAEATGGHWYISAITLIEVRYLVEKDRFPESLWDLVIARLDDERTVRLLPVDAGIAYKLDEIPRGTAPDMPDRIIAATAVAYLLPLVTRDRKIQAVPGLTIIW